MVSSQQDSRLSRFEDQLSPQFLKRLSQIQTSRRLPQLPLLKRTPPKQLILGAEHCSWVIPSQLFNPATRGYNITARCTNNHVLITKSKSRDQNVVILQRIVTKWFARGYKHTRMSSLRMAGLERCGGCIFVSLFYVFYVFYVFSVNFREYWH